MHDPQLIVDNRFIRPHFRPFLNIDQQVGAARTAVASQALAIASWPPYAHERFLTQNPARMRLAPTLPCRAALSKAMASVSLMKTTMAALRSGPSRPWRRASHLHAVRRCGNCRWLDKPSGKPIRKHNRRQTTSLINASPGRGGNYEG